MYKIEIEYWDGTIERYEVAERLWYRFLMPALENDDTVKHYTISKIMEVNF